MSVEELNDIQPDLLEQIVSCDKLRLVDEDSFLDWICALDEKHSSLLHCVECRYLSSQGIDKFLSRISFENLDGRSWKSICQRLRCELRDRCAYSKRNMAVHFPTPVGFDDLEGIIFELKFRPGSFVITSAGSTTRDGFVPGVNNVGSSNARGNSDNTLSRLIRPVFLEGTVGELFDEWQSANMQNAWVQFSFRRSSVCIEGYAIRAGGAVLPVGWVIEGSNDGNKWELIDSRTEAAFEPNGMLVFRLERPVGAFFESVRIRQTQKNSEQTDLLVLKRVEFYGLLLLRTSDK
jgi:hypothetical protein